MCVVLCPCACGGATHPHSKPLNSETPHSDFLRGPGGWCPHRQGPAAAVSRASFCTVSPGPTGQGAEGGGRPKEPRGFPAAGPRCRAAINISVLGPRGAPSSAPATSDMALQPKDRDPEGPEPPVGGHKAPAHSPQPPCGGPRRHPARAHPRPHSGGSVPALATCCHTPRGRPWPGPRGRRPRSLPQAPATRLGSAARGPLAPKLDLMGSESPEGRT